MAQYTERFSDFLERKEQSTEWQTKVKAMFDKIPTFTLYDININMYDMFKNDNAFKEIGSETEEMFIYNCSRVADEVVIEYAPKIKLFISNFTSLMDRKLSLSASGNGSASGNSSNKGTHYLNPNTSNESLSSIDDMNKNDGTSTSNTSFNETRETSYSFFKSNPEMLGKSMEIKNVFLEGLKQFDKLFIGVL